MSLPFGTPLSPSPLIIGGGPAGAAAAAILAAAGCAPTLIERSPGPSDKVCGDFLGSPAIALARRLGVDPVAIGGHPITRLRLIHGATRAETPLPFPALGLSRWRLDEALLRVAAENGAALLRGHRVRTVRPENGRIVAHADGLDRIEAQTVFLATGKHDLRGMARIGRQGSPVGMKMYFALKAAEYEQLAGCVELVLFPGGYAGLLCVEEGRAVLCALVQDPVGWLDHLVRHSPHLANRLAGATPLLPRPLAIAGLPYGRLHRGTARDPGWLFQLGDQAAVIPSLTGDGVAIALHTGALAARTWLAGGDAAAYHRAVHRSLRGQMRLSGLVHAAFTGCHTQAPVFWLARVCPAAVRLVARWTRTGVFSS